MIVRLAGEGQYEIDEAVMERLNSLDQQAIAALERSDEPELDRYLDEMGTLVRQEGRKLAVDELASSDVVIPPSDLTLEETRRLVAKEGFIPDPPA